MIYSVNENVLNMNHFYAHFSFKVKIVIQDFVEKVFLRLRRSTSRERRAMDTNNSVALT